MIKSLLRKSLRSASFAAIALALATGCKSKPPLLRDVDALGHTCMVAVGLEVPESVTGSTVSVHLVLDSAAPCGSTVPLTAHWQWWDGATWQALAVSDGTHGLREAGLVRFVAPQEIGRASCRERV